MIPIRDENRSLTTPHMTRVFIIINIVVFLVYWLSDLFNPYKFFGYSSLERAITTYGMVPNDVMQGKRLYTLFTSMFMHGGFIHLGGNMLYLYIFGDNIEDAFGHSRYFLFYFISGLAASAAHIFTDVNSVIPAVGASGAISGVLGAYMVLYPKARVLSLVLVGWIYIVPIPAIFFLGFWFVFQLLYGILEFEFGVPSGVAYWAHIGGFIAGIIFGLVWRGRRRIRAL